TCRPTSRSFSPLRATRAIAPQSRASRSAVARPMPELAPVTIATEFDMGFSALGLHGLNGQADVHVVADHEATGLEHGVVGHPEVLAIDRHAGFEAGSDVPERVGDGPEIHDGQRDRP